VNSAMLFGPVYGCRQNLERRGPDWTRPSTRTALKPVRSGRAIADRAHSRRVTAYRASSPSPWLGRPKCSVRLAIVDDAYGLKVQIAFGPSADRRR
jgi:hypothetical protein